MIIAPTLHCSQMGATEHTVVGERDLGDGRFDYVSLVQDWFDHFVKGVDNAVLSQPRVRAYMMGANQWRTYDSWPVKEAHDVAYYLDSDGGANTRLGDGRLTTAKPGKAASDHFTYDPMTPVPTVAGGTWCCYSRSVLTTAEPAGAVDQSGLEMRADVLVYTTPPLTHPVEVMGPVKVTLYLSSDRKDTDLTVKLIDVGPDGKAYNLDDTIQRVRWRDGWDHAGIHAARPGLQGGVEPIDHGQRLCGGPPDSHRSVEQQLPALRAEPEHRAGTTTTRRTRSSRTT